MSANIPSFQQFKSSRKIGIPLPKEKPIPSRRNRLEPRQLSFLPVNTNINGLPVIPCILQKEESSSSSKDGDRDESNSIGRVSILGQPANQSNDIGRISILGQSTNQQDEKEESPLMVEVSDDIVSFKGSVDASVLTKTLPPSAPNKHFSFRNRLGSFISDAPALRRELAPSLHSLGSISSGSFSIETKLGHEDTALERFIHGDKKGDGERRNAVVPMLLRDVLHPLTKEDRGKKTFKLIAILEYSSLIWHYMGYRFERGDTHTYTARERWRFAIRTIAKLLQTFNHQPSLFERDIFSEQGPTAEYIFRLYKYINNIALSSKIQYHYSNDDQERNYTRLLHYFSKRCQFFSKVNYEKIVRIMKYVSYMRVQNGTPIVKQGRKAEDVYFILSGQVTLYKAVYDSDSVSQVPTMSLMAGDSIIYGEGSPSFQNIMARDGTMVAVGPCELLRMSRCIVDSHSRFP